MRHVPACLAAGVVVLAGAPGYCPPASASAPATASGSNPPAGKHCVAATQARFRAAGDSGGAPLKFSEAFYKRMYNLTVSLDGLDGHQLPISIEEICDVPKARAKEAVQLAGNDGIARILARTQVWQGKTRLLGTDATTAVDGADTAILRVRLARPRTWGKDEDGNPVPTFRAGRIDITD